MKILVVINPYSGKAKHGFFEPERFKEIFRKYMAPEHKYEIFKSTSMEDLEKRIKEFVREFDIIAPTGGDGTLNHFINLIAPFLSSKNIPIFPIGGGSMNVIQKNILPSQKIGTAPRLLCDIVNQISSPDDLGRFIKKVCTMQFLEGENRRYGFMFANGLIYKAMERYYSKGKVGPEYALSLMFETLFDILVRRKSELFEKIEADVKVDGVAFPYKKIVTCIASSFRKMVLFTKPFVETGREGFYFMVSADDLFYLALNFLWIAFGKKVPPKTLNRKVKKVRIEFDGGYTIDGELFERKRVYLEISEGIEVPFLTFPEAMKND